MSIMQSAARRWLIASLAFLMPVLLLTSLATASTACLSTSASNSSPQVPTVTPYQMPGEDCYQIANFSQLNLVTLTLNNNTFNVVENYISPTDAGISVNNQSIALVMNESVPFIKTFSANLTGLSYLSTQCSLITVLICQQVPALALQSPVSPPTTIPAPVALAPAVPQGMSAGTIMAAVSVALAAAVAVSIGITLARNRQGGGQKGDGKGSAGQKAGEAEAESD